MNTEQASVALGSCCGLAETLCQRLDNPRVTVPEVETYLALLTTIKDLCTSWQMYLRQQQGPGPDPDPPTQGGPSPFDPSVN